MSNTKNINVNVQRPPTNIPLGRQGENLATCIIFDCTGLVQLYGDGTAELLHELKDGTVYPVAIKQDGTSVSWIVTASDTATVGAGRAELRWYVGDTLAKSAKFRTSVSSALPDTSVSTPPEPQKSWVDKVLAAAQEIKDGAISDEKLAAAIAAYLEEHPIDAGLDEAELAAYLVENGYLKNTDLADAVAQALAEAKASGEFDGAPGKDGADGSPGADGADGVGIESVVQTTTSTEDGGTNIVTVTKTDGSTSTFEVRNGSKGNDGAPGADGKDGAPGADGKTPVYGVDYGTPEQITRIAQSAAEILKPDVDQIKGDLSNKLPKSPTDWQEWTTDERASARERIGLIGYELVVDVPTLETASNFHITLDSNGNALALKAVAIDFAGAADGGNCLVEISNGYLKFTASLSQGRFGSFVGVPLGNYYFYCFTNNSASLNQTNGNANYFVAGLKSGTTIRDIWFRGTVPAGASIQIYGIRG